MECLQRPNRSDAHLSVEEEAKIEGETRDYFDGLAPKRHTKPQRSEFASTYADANSTAENTIPEYVEFQRLENDQQRFEYSTGSKVDEDFVETEYYKDMNCVDKQHHTTGTGFIKMEDGNTKSYSIAPETDFTHHSSCKGNPATNDWTPSTDEQVRVVYQKPGRSDN